MIIILELSDPAVDFLLPLFELIYLIRVLLKCLPIGMQESINEDLLINHELILALADLKYQYLGWCLNIHSLLNFIQHECILPSLQEVRYVLQSNHIECTLIVVLDLLAYKQIKNGMYFLIFL